MTSPATQPVQQASGTAVNNASRAAELRAANINPRTGLATDYLNHFNEAIMLLEMIPDMVECAEDFLAWTPLSYAEHFTASNFKARDLARGGRGHARGGSGPDQGQACRTGDRLAEAAGIGGRRRHPRRLGGRRR